MRRGPKGNTAKVIADAEKIARRYRKGDTVKQLVLEYHSQLATIKRTILTQISAAEYRELGFQHRSRSQKGKHSQRKVRIPDRHPGKKPTAENVEQLRRDYEQAEKVLAEAVKKEAYQVPAGYSKLGRASNYVNALDADRMLMEANGPERSRIPQDEKGGIRITREGRK